MSIAKNMIGERFERLMVISRAGSSAQGKALWLCRCDCGNLTTVQGSNLRNGHTQSCGCLQSETTRKRNFVHGKRKTKTYAVWGTMLQRCINPNNHKYKNYGGRGIKICDEWANDFQAFYSHVSQLPHFGEIGYSFDRINNEGNYEPGNVRWATARQQRLNQRRVYLMNPNREAEFREYARS